MTPEQLKAGLEKLLPLREMKIEVGGTPGNLVAQVLSRDYAGVEDHVRQAQVWYLLAKEYGDGVANAVEFVFTLTPEEQDELVKQAAAEEEEEEEETPAVDASSS